MVVIVLIYERGCNMVQFYGYKRCGTCRKGEKHLNENGVEYQFIDITVAPPGLAELRQIITNSGKPLKKFFNTSGVVYREERIKDKLPSMSEDEQIKLLASNGKLLKRPIVSDGNKSSVGYNEDEFNSLWV